MKDAFRHPSVVSEFLPQYTNLNIALVLQCLLNMQQLNLGFCTMFCNSPYMHGWPANDGQDFIPVDTFATPSQVKSPKRRGLQKSLLPATASVNGSGTRRTKRRLTLNSHASGSGSDSSWNLEPLPSSYGSNWFRFRGHVSQVYLTKVPQVLTAGEGFSGRFRLEPEPEPDVCEFSVRPEMLQYDGYFACLRIAVQIVPLIRRL